MAIDYIAIQLLEMRHGSLIPFNINSTNQILLFIIWYFTAAPVTNMDTGALS